MSYNSIAVTRVQRELKDIKSEKHSGQFQVDLVDDQFNSLTGKIRGPPGTPYEGGLYDLSIEIPDTYPFNPPKVRFRTKIWHPNISSVTGAICLDILKDNWAAALTLRTVLLSLQALLSSPEPDDPQDAVVAGQYKREKDMFLKTARYWAQKYAFATTPSDSNCDSMIRRLIDMGFAEEKAVQALSSRSWSLEAAIQDLAG